MKRVIKMIYTRLRLGDFVTNTYIIADNDSGKAILVDPADSHEKIEKRLDGLVPEIIFLTHGHSDHMYEIQYFREKYGAKVYAHADERPYFEHEHVRNPIGVPIEEREYVCDVTVADGDVIEFGPYSFTVIHTPGHTPGSVCYYCEKEKVLFSGDTLFNNSIGRTDFPLSNSAIMSSSVLKLMNLPDDTVLESGHGFTSTIGKERIGNPFVQAFMAGLEL